MKRTPFLNALGAVLYIVCLVLLVNFALMGKDEPEILMPMTMLTLFVLSASVMGYFFILEPVTMYIDGQKAEAVSFFTKTIGFFSLFALGFIVLVALV